MVAPYRHGGRHAPQRALFAHVAWTVLLSLLPALVIEYLFSRMMQKPRAKLAARGIADADVTDPALAHEQRAAEHAEAIAERSGDDVAVHAAERKVENARGQRHTARHWTLLQRLPIWC